jgi:hypothetical protein
VKFVRAWVCAAALLPAGAFAGGQDIQSGAALHEAHCTRCHSADIYTRPQRLVNSYAELRKRVQQCELNAELGWFDEEVEAVVAYLNDAYYKFTIEN